MAALGGLAALRFDAARVKRFLPPCPFHALTGCYCPGCGSTRAVTALLHGDLLSAWHFNPLFMLSLPAIAAILVTDRYTAQPLSRSPAFVRGCLVVIVLFGILRNLPWAPFNSLAPH